MNFIKKIFEEQIDESVHRQFQKFSRGEFQNKALIKAKKATTGKYTINTTYEFANELIREIAKKLDDEKTLVKGAIVSTVDLEDAIKPKDKKQFQGVKRYIIEREISGNRIIDLLDKFPKAFFGLSFETKDSKLKIKPKAPKSGKPSSKGEKKQTPNFCRLKTTDSDIARSFVFEKPDFKEAYVEHIFLIDELIIPEELRKTNDFAWMRKEAKRKGKIIRKAVIDGKEINSEKEFTA